MIKLVFVAYNGRLGVLYFLRYHLHVQKGGAAWTGTNVI
jgi:hypothetical protein